LYIVLLLAAPSVALGANGANFVLYTHHTEEPGELKVMFMNDIGQEADTTRYVAQMVELELGITERWTTGFMVEGQTTSGEGGYNFTGFRWENRYRLFEYGRFLNPVLYVEYEDLGEDTKYAMEVSGREDATVHVKSRERERVLETRLILGHDFTNRFNVAFNWLNESDLDTGVTAFGYAAGLNYELTTMRRTEDNHGSHPGITFGLEVFGALGDSDKGITADAKITQHYLAPNMMLHITDSTMVKFGGAVGLTNVSQDIFRMAIGYKF
jgi:hypothetical protein